MKGSVGITGTPGTGKKSISKLVAVQLGLEPSSLNELAKEFRVLDPTTGEVDTDALARRLAGHGQRKDALYFGHLLPYVFGRGSLTRVVVLRCDPGVLRGRLAGRGYKPKKLIEDVEAELIGLISSDAFNAFGSARTFEYDTTYTSAEEASLDIANSLSGRTLPRARIDWTENYDSGPKLRLLLSTGS